MAHDVFISYSSEDIKAAEAVCAKLESEGVKCWIASRDIQPSEIYAKAITSGLSNSRLVILIFSSHATESKHVAVEINLAHDENIPIIPLRLQDIPLSGALKYYLSNAQWFDASTTSLDKHLEKLSKVVQQLLKTYTNTVSNSDNQPQSETNAINSLQSEPKTNLQKLLSAITPLKAVASFIILIAVISLIYWLLNRSPIKGTWGIALQLDESSIDDARYNLQNMAKANGFNDSYIFKRPEGYRTVAIFKTKEEAQEQIPKARRLNPSVSDPKELDTWCPKQQWNLEREYFECE